MAAVVVDTHAVVWYLLKDPRLSKVAEAALDAATGDGDPIYVPSICLVEITYLVEKGRLPARARQILADALDGPDDPFALKALDREVADALPRVPRAEVPDLPDRLIAATALVLGLPLISRDGRIRAAQLQTIW